MFISLLFKILYNFRYFTTVKFSLGIRIFKISMTISYGSVSLTIFSHSPIIQNTISVLPYGAKLLNFCQN